MKRKFTDKGISLVILIVIITVIGALGAGIISLMGAKQKAYLAQAQAYQALNLAHAGIEFAIRYAHDRFAYNNETITEALGTEKIVNFGNGKFTLIYDAQNHILTSIGELGNAKRVVQLKDFKYYLNGSKLFLTGLENINFRPIQGCYDDICPSKTRKNQFISIPITNDYGQDVYVRYIEVTLSPSQGSSNLIAGVYSGSNPNPIYSPSTDSSNVNYVKKGNDEYICIPEPDGIGNCRKECSSPRTPAKIPYVYNLNLRLPPGPSIEILDFKSASIKGTYTIKFYFDSDTNYQNIKTSTMTFTIN